MDSGGPFLEVLGDQILAACLLLDIILASQTLPLKSSFNDLFCLYLRLSVVGERSAFVY